MLREQLLAELRRMDWAERMETARDLIEVGRTIIEEGAKQAIGADGAPKQDGEGKRWQEEESG